MADPLLSPGVDGGVVVIVMLSTVVALVLLLRSVPFMVWSERSLAPYLARGSAFMAFAIVPVGGTFELFHHSSYMQLADRPVGILFLRAMSSVAVYGVMLAGWASGSKSPLLGAVRASAQMVSYE